MERNLWNERSMFLTLKTKYFQLWFPSRSDLCTYATETVPLSIVFKGSDRLSKVLELSMQCCGKLLYRSLNSLICLK